MSFKRIHDCSFDVFCIKDYTNINKNFIKNQKYRCDRKDSYSKNYDTLEEGYIIRYFIGGTLFLKKDEIFKIINDNLEPDENNNILVYNPLFTEYFITVSEHRDKIINQIFK